MLPDDQLATAVLDCARLKLGHLDQRQQRQLIALLRAARAPHEAPGSEW